MLVGQRIKELRIEKGISQQELGDLIGVTKVSICGYENGTRIPSLEIFETIANVFGTSTDFLLGREVNIVNEQTGEHIGLISEDDINLIYELRHYPTLYTKMTKDIKRYVSLVNKKMR